MSSTGLIPCSTSQATAEQWGRRQLDWVLVSQCHKRIAILDLCSPSDVHPAQLFAATMRKQQTCLPLQDALHYYSGQGWTSLGPTSKATPMGKPRGSTRNAVESMEANGASTEQENLMREE
jgi:hypothetical protein